MKNIIVIVMYIIGTPVLAFAQQNLWQNIPLDFNDIYLSNTAGPSIMYYDSATNASYIAGTFQKIGDSVCNVVELDSNGFTLLPSSPLPFTYDIIRFHGKLYFSGPGLATWDGHNWMLLDSINGVGSLMVHNDSLWALVSLNSGSGIPTTTVAVWENDSWVNMYRADTIIGDWTPYQLAFYKNELYIAGNINNHNHPTINEIARFDGTKWTDVGGFHGGNISDVRKLIVWRDTLYAGGLFDESSGSPGNGIAKWDGSQWHRLNDGVWQYGGPAITDLMVFHNELYACGWFNVVDGIDQGGTAHISTGFAKWDGSRWCTLGTKANNVIFTMGQFRDSLYIMGGFDTLNNQPMWHMAKWIGGDYTDSCSQPVPAGVSEISSDNKVSLLVFPNPAQNILNIKYNNPLANSGNALITVTDLLGRHILSKNIKIKQGENLWHLNTAAIPPGIYFLEINNAECKSIAKFVKQ